MDEDAARRSCKVHYHTPVTLQQGEVSVGVTPGRPPTVVISREHCCPTPGVYSRNACVRLPRMREEATLCTSAAT